MYVRLRWAMGGLACGWLLAGAQAFAAEAPSPDKALAIRPVQRDVEIETPDAKDFDQCKVTVEKQGKSSGWIVTGPQGQTLRRFVDTNGDNVVDQWRYYLNGMEVYRDVDSNYNNKVDQFRWFNTAGSRWGAASKEDGRIDSWKSISAEEASREAIRALAGQDETVLAPLLVTKDDLSKLGIKGEIAEKIVDNVSGPGAKLKKIAGQSKVLNAKSKWMRFDCSMPAVVPSEQLGAKSDVTVYENAMAIVEGSGEPVLVQIGEMILIGDTWKLTRLPQPIEGNAVQVAEGGLLMQPAVAAVTSPAASGNAVEPNPKMQKLIEKLQALDKASPGPTASPKAYAKYNNDRADVIQELLDASTTDEEKEQWTRQLIDAITAAVQTGSFPAGVKRLDKLNADLKKKSPKSPLVAYVAYRRLLADYSIELQDANAEERNKLQDRWLKDLEAFVKAHPKAEDAAEAELQLGITEEFNGRVKEAREWYAKLTEDHPEAQAAQRATGALHRLDLKGNTIELHGASLSGGDINISSYKGKVVLVLFWATWCKPCTEDLPELRALYEKYHDRGFEVIGVNLDSEKAEIQPYLKEYRVTWPQIYEPGSFESTPARTFGIISLPTMFLVGDDGKVLNRSETVADLKTALPELLKKD
ncbi:MAG TPA: TlpA disulfide reductase family protein [Planctomycetaceae bacterium]|nr:TlpA disulfide reductase family protein [Planctomycetaceae bacterium]